MNTFFEIALFTLLVAGMIGCMFYTFYMVGKEESKIAEAMSEDEKSNS